MVRACDLILRHAAGRTLDDYECDAFFRAGVERCFEVIGEAMRRLDRQDPPTAALIPDHRDIIDFRNVLAHGYDIVDHARVWSYIQHDLPRLREHVLDLLRGVDGDEDG